MDKIEESARKAAQEVYEEAQKEYAAKQEAWKAEQKERYKQAYERINNGNSTCMGYMARGSAVETKTDGSAD